MIWIYSDAYILVNGTITFAKTGTAAKADNIVKKVTFKIYAPFIDCICEINNTQGDNTNDIDVVMLMYNLIEHTDIYSKTCSRL